MSLVPFYTLDLCLDLSSFPVPSKGSWRRKEAFSKKGWGGLSRCCAVWHCYKWKVKSGWSVDKDSQGGRTGLPYTHHFE